MQFNYEYVVHTSEIGWLKFHDIYIKAGLWAQLLPISKQLMDS